MTAAYAQEYFYGPIEDATPLPKVLVALVQDYLYPSRTQTAENFTLYKITAQYFSSHTNFQASTFLRLDGLRIPNFPCSSVLKNKKELTLIVDLAKSCLPIASP